jgi:type I restriction enzyme S subunit
MSASHQPAALKQRNKPAQGKERSDAALGHASQNTSSPEEVNDMRRLPAAWRWAKMSEVCSRVQDGTHFSPKEQTRTGDFKYITAKNIKHWGLDLTELTYVPEHVHREIYKRCNVEKGDVLYIKDGVTTGIATVNTLDEEFSLLSSVALLKPRRDILDSLFLKYYLNSPEGFRNMTGQMTGTAIKRLILQKIKAAVVPVAPLPEQRRIVAEIEKQFTRLEVGVAALRRVQANLKRYRAAVLKAACEGRLVPTEAALARSPRSTKNGPPTYEPGEALLARILTERRQNWQGRGQYKEPAAPDTAGLPLLPDGWAWATVEQLSTRVQYGSSAKTNEDSTGVPVLRMGNIQEGKFDFDKLKYLPKKHDEFPELLLARGDLLFNRTNSAELVGKTAVFKDTPQPCSFASYLIRVRFGAGCLPDFVSYFINSVFGRAWIADVVSQQVGQANVNGTKLQALAIPLPPLAEQTRIVAEVERRLSVVEELESVVTANLQRATRLRQSILQKAFTGAL